MAASEATYKELALRYLDEEFPGGRQPTRYSPAWLASVLMDAGALAGWRNWALQRAEKRGEVPVQWVPLKSDDHRDGLLLQALQSRRYSLPDEVREQLDAVRTFIRPVVPLQSSASGLVIEIDQFNSPAWLLPADVFRTVADSRNSARAGFLPLLKQLSQGYLDQRASHAVGASNVHGLWIMDTIGGRKWATARNLFVPFSHLEHSEQAKDRAFALAPVESFRRTLIEVNMLAEAELFSLRRRLPRLDLTWEESRIAPIILEELVGFITPGMQSAYRAHFGEGGHGSPGDETLLDHTSQTVPDDAKATNRMAALQLVVSLTDVLLDSHGDIHTSAPELVQDFLDTYDDHQRRQRGEKGQGKRRAAGDLSNDEYLLNVRMVEMGVALFASFVDQIGQAAGMMFDNERLMDPLARALQFHHHPELSALGLPQLLA